MYVEIELSIKKKNVASIILKLPFLFKEEEFGNYSCYKYL